MNRGGQIYKKMEKLAYKKFEETQFVSQQKGKIKVREGNNSTRKGGNSITTSEGSKRYKGIKSLGRRIERTKCRK